MQRLGHHIDGTTGDPIGGRWLDVHDPANGQPYAQVAAGDPRDVDAAVGAAADALPAWSSLAASERARHMERLADALEARLDDFAHAESRDGGKPLRAGARRRDPARGVQPALLRACGDAVRQRIAPRPGRAQLHPAPAARRGRHDLAVEPAAVPVHLEDRTRAGRGQYRGREAVRGHAGDGDDARRARRGNRIPARRAQHRARAGR